jgi:hypothetical protein
MDAKLLRVLSGGDVELLAGWLMTDCLALREKRIIPAHLAQRPMNINDMVEPPNFKWEDGFENFYVKKISAAMQAIVAECQEHPHNVDNAYLKPIINAIQNLEDLNDSHAVAKALANVTVPAPAVQQKLANPFKR